jgi:hypothetical protein
MLNIVFFAVLLSAALQGATVEALANRLLADGTRDSRHPVSDARRASWSKPVPPQTTTARTTGPPAR